MWKGVWSWDWREMWVYFIGCWTHHLTLKWWFFICGFLRSTAYQADLLINTCMTLILYCQGQSLKSMLCLINERADWHGMKGMWVDRIRMLWPCITVSQEWEGRLTWNHWSEVIWVNRMLDPLCDLELWPWPLIFKFKFWNCCISWMGGPIDME